MIDKRNFKRDYTPYGHNLFTVQDFTTKYGDVDIRCRDGKCSGISSVLISTSKFLKSLLCRTRTVTGYRTEMRTELDRTCEVILPDATTSEVMLLTEFLTMGQIKGSNTTYRSLKKMIRMLKVEIRVEDIHKTRVASQRPSVEVVVKEEPVIANNSEASYVHDITSNGNEVNHVVDIVNDLDNDLDNDFDNHLDNDLDIAPQHDDQLMTVDKIDIEDHMEGIDTGTDFNFDDLRSPPESSLQSASEPKPMPQSQLPSVIQNLSNNPSNLERIPENETAMGTSFDPIGEEENRVVSPQRTSTKAPGSNMKLKKKKKSKRISNWQECPDCGSKQQGNRNMEHHKKSCTGRQGAIKEPKIAAAKSALLQNSDQRTPQTKTLAPTVDGQGSANSEEQQVAATAINNDPANNASHNERPTEKTMPNVVVARKSIPPQSLDMSVDDDVNDVDDADRGPSCEPPDHDVDVEDVTNMETSLSAADPPNGAANKGTGPGSMLFGCTLCPEVKPKVKEFFLHWKQVHITANGESPDMSGIDRTCLLGCLSCPMENGQSDAMEDPLAARQVYRFRYICAHCREPYRIITEGDLTSKYACVCVDENTDDEEIDGDIEEEADRLPESEEDVDEPDEMANLSDVEEGDGEDDLNENRDADFPGRGVEESIDKEPSIHPEMPKLSMEIRVNLQPLDMNQLDGRNQSVLRSHQKNQIRSRIIQKGDDPSVDTAERKTKNDSSNFIGLRNLETEPSEAKPGASLSVNQ